MMTSTAGGIISVLMTGLIKYRLDWDDGSDRCGSDKACTLRKKDMENCSWPHLDYCPPKHHPGS